MKKKIILIIALVLVAALAFAGVWYFALREKPLLDPDKPVTITMWHYYNSMQMEAFDAMVEEFNHTTGREEGIFVEAFSQGNVSELFNKVLDTAKGIAGEGDLPHIFLAYSDSTYELVEMDKVVPLETYMTEDEIHEYVPGFWQEGIIGGKSYVFPIAKSTELLCVDEVTFSEFAQATGLQKSISECFSTWESIRETAAAFYDYTDALTPESKNDGRALIGIDSISNYALVALKQLGVDFMQNEDGRPKITYDDAAMRRMWDNYVVAMARGHFASIGHFGSDDVKTGLSMGFAGSSAGAGYFPDVITFEDGTQRPATLMAIPYPVFEGGEKYVVQQGAGMVVTRSDEAHEYASIEFAKWLTDVERNIDFAMNSSYMPVKTEALTGDKMEARLNEMVSSDDAGERNLANVFRVTASELTEYGLYFSSPFTGRLQIRYQFDDLKQYAIDARAQVLTDVQAGVDYEEAVERACGDEAFTQWYEGLKGNIASILGE